MVLFIYSIYHKSILKSHVDAAWRYHVQKSEFGKKKNGLRSFSFLVTIMEVVYLWGFYDIKFILTQCKSKPGLIPQYT